MTIVWFIFQVLGYIAMVVYLAGFVLVAARLAYNARQVSSKERLDWSIIITLALIWPIYITVHGMDFT